MILCGSWPEKVGVRMGFSRSPERWRPLTLLTALHPQDRPVVHHQPPTLI